MMHTKKIIIFIGLIVFSLAVYGCAAKIKPFTAGSNVKPETEGENRLWCSAEKMDASLKKSRQIYEDEVLRSYVQSVMDGLYPDFKGKIRVYLLKAPVLNAFALPNGSIYVNVGLIAAMENEAQLATVLAHEGIHFLQKHSALQRVKFNRSAGFSVAISLLGVPFIGDLAAMSSIFGYSRELERESDQLGFKRLCAAGYDVRESYKSFEHLALEAKANKRQEPFFFATHPKLQERIESFKELIEATNEYGDNTGSVEYQEHVGKLRMKVLAAKIDVGKYNSTIAVLTSPAQIQLYSHRNKFYLGEAYRLRNSEGDSKLAIESYEDLIKSYPNYAPVYKSLGIMCLKKKDLAKARGCFEKYIELSPNADDIDFIKQYLENIKQQEG